MAFIFVFQLIIIHKLISFYCKFMFNCSSSFTVLRSKRLLHTHARTRSCTHAHTLTHRRSSPSRVGSHWCSPRFDEREEGKRSKRAISTSSVVPCCSYWAKSAYLAEITQQLILVCRWVQNRARWTAINWKWLSSVRQSVECRQGYWQ